MSGNDRLAMAPISNFIDHCLFVCILLVSKKSITSHCSYRHSSQAVLNVPTPIYLFIIIFWKTLRPAYHISPQYLLVMLHNKSNLTHSLLINNQILKIAKNTTGREERGEYFTLNWRSSIESGLLKVFWTGFM